MTGSPILEVRDVAVDYGWGASALHALAGVDVTLHRGEVLGIAGESGSGKSTLASAVTWTLCLARAGSSRGALSTTLVPVSFTVSGRR